MESREEKFRKHREDIELQEKTEVLETLMKEEEASVDSDRANRNTLTLSIDKILEAHDEYTVIIEQKELKEKIRQEKKLQRKDAVKVFFKYFGIGIALALIVTVLILIFLTVLN